MKVVLAIKEDPRGQLLIDLRETDLIRRVIDLVDKKEFSGAMALTLEEGAMLKKVSKEEIYFCEPNLIISEDDAYWDLL